jgi:predicted metal-dependent hydrolase
VTATIRLGELDIPYTVRPSARARRISLRIREPGIVEVVVPVRHVVPHPETILHRHAGWILRTFERLRRAGAGGKSFGEGSRILFLGTERTVRVERSERKRPSIILTESEIVVRLSPASSGDIRPLLGRWMRREAVSILPARVSELNAGWGLRYANVAVRNQRTRWGSCSRRGNLSFNWRLVILPPEVAEYLIFHELAHLKYLDHSPRFWRFVESMCPGFRHSERWLRKYGRSIPL